MARIRSIHPGFFTDEAIVQAAPLAQVFLIGLWTQCDDQGVFEWKPLTLKMRILPAANCDVTLLLAQLAGLGIVRQIEVGPSKYGLVRNFRRYQRPKKPNSTHPLPDEFRPYVGLDRSSPELSPQREEGGGRMKGEEGGGEKEPAGAAAPPPAQPPAPSDGDLAPPRALDRAPEVEALELWNETAGRAGLPLAQRLTDARRKALQFRLAEAGGIEGWKIALSKIEASAFLTGKSRRSDDHANWRCDIDFMLRQAKFTKLMEGGFDDTPSTRKQSSADPRFEALAEFGRAGAG